MQYRLLSYRLNKSTPTYGNKSKLGIDEVKSIAKGDTVNESNINLPLHAGTHIDLPKHFFENGQTLADFPESFWVFNNPLIINISVGKSLVLNNEVTDILENKVDSKWDILLINLSPAIDRNSSEYWKNNYGFSAEVILYIRNNFPSVRAMGFNSISLSSIKYPEEGKNSHIAALNPERPILVIEDMNLSPLTKEMELNKLIVSPLMVEGVEGLPVTVWGEVRA